ncbi:hypothetical protein CB0940_04614 [Cercospora beticola]|uniref:Uncharacterized protein n=1 Tax=Cercospora beticola TaxID=122368 RepID=A0A2G5HKP7_CERBT|nr:hypothetical protein CB0940_04614 [Cercospora beticola]PIA92782.1 hypothetical protein CB0940_04614 [Cercospora beticola]
MLLQFEMLFTPIFHRTRTCNAVQGFQVDSELESSSVVPAFQAGSEEAFDLLLTRGGCSRRSCSFLPERAAHTPCKIRPCRCPLKKRRIRLKHYPSRQQ